MSEKPRQLPSVGRVVHYVTKDGRHVPADICEVDEAEYASLYVKDPRLNGARFEYSVPHRESHAPDSWHWPEHVPPAPGTKT